MPGKATPNQSFSVGRRRKRFDPVKIYRHLRAPKATAGIFWNDLRGWQPICRRQGGRTVQMLHYALVFLLIAIVAAIFGFGGIAVTSAYIAKILFLVFLVLFIVSLITHLGRRRI
jgi:uncharacterized membrane protein YtjA (UPF0391 family)